MYHYVYRLDHLETGEFYIGSRSSKVHPSLDSYMGSMSTWKPDKTKLKKTILRDDFKNRTDAIQFEAENITKCINEDLNRNYHIPPNSFHTIGMVSVIDKNGNTFKVFASDDRYINGEFISVSKGKITVKDVYDNKYRVSIDDPRYKSGEFVTVLYNTIMVKDIHDNIFRVSKDDPRYKSGEYVHYLKGTLIVIDKSGKKIRTSTNDPKYISGELIPVWKNKNYTTKKIKNTCIKNTGRMGERSPAFGRCWINNTIENKFVKNEELNYYIDDNWICGRIK